MSEQFKLVPVEPTPEMISAYLKAQGDAARSTDKAWGVSDPKENFKAGFAAMLDAAPTQGADARPVAMPNLDGDWSPISETLVHRLRDPIPAHALADMPERMAEAINVITEEAADAIESLCGQFRELEYIMECSKNAKSVAALNLNLESALGDGGLLDANLEATRDAAPIMQNCGCATCRPITLTDMRMIVCKTCGNKRCPHSTDHNLECTGSNEPGQPGSSYTASAPREAS